jgi:hypothetical protein
LAGPRSRGDRRQVGIPGEAILGADFAALPDVERLVGIENIGVVGRVAPGTRCCLPTH